MSEFEKDPYNDKRRDDILDHIVKAVWTKNWERPPQEGVDYLVKCRDFRYRIAHMCDWEWYDSTVEYSKVIDVEFWRRIE